MPKHASGSRRVKTFRSDLQLEPVWFDVCECLCCLTADRPWPKARYRTQNLVLRTEWASFDTWISLEATNTARAVCHSAC